MTRDYYRKHYALESGEVRANNKHSGRRQLAFRSITDVARMLGISKQAVNQIERRAILKLRRAFISRGLVGG